MVFHCPGTSLGATETEPLPDGLFKGLTRLETLDMNHCGQRTLPSFADLAALKLFTGVGAAQVSPTPLPSKAPKCCVTVYCRVLEGPGHG